jgi:hypothetical protein
MVTDLSMLPLHAPCGIGYGELAADLSITCEVRRTFRRVATDRDKRGVYEHTDSPGCGARCTLDSRTGQRTMEERR